MIKDHIKSLLKGFVDIFLLKKLHVEGYPQDNSGEVKYILPILDEKSVVISGGIGKDLSFEKDLWRIFSPQIYIYDPSPTGINTIKQEQDFLREIHFESVGIASQTGEAGFTPPDDPEEGSWSVSRGQNAAEKFFVKDLTTISRENEIEFIDLLKIDIEGFEYEVIKDLLQKRIKAAQICVEFHYFFKGFSLLGTLWIIILMRWYGFSVINRNGPEFTFANLGYLKDV